MIDLLKRHGPLYFACSVLILESVVISMVRRGIENTRQSGPDFLSYAELVTLSEHNEIPLTLNSKLTALLTTPFVNNEASSREARPHRPRFDRIGPEIRLVQWNIERDVAPQRFRTSHSGLPQRE
jgi:hypothetical protein